jgi:DNA polymerase III epsilon subunit-like protein
MKRIYFDTETTGFPAKAGTPLDRCPFVCQLAAILVDDEHGEVASLNTIIKPAGWTISDDVAAIHGITTAKAEAFGIPARVAFAAFSQLCRVADQAVAHNIGFDLEFVSYEVERAGAENVILSKPHFCTMEATTDLCKIPGRYPGKFKWPKLMEAHIHLLGGGFDDAHDALADVRACYRVHKHLLENQLI